MWLIVIISNTFYKTGINNETNVAFSGRNDNGTFRLGVTNGNSDEVIKHAGSEQQGLNFNSNYNLTNRLHLTFSASYMHEKVRNRPWNSDAPGKCDCQYIFFGVNL